MLDCGDLVQADRDENSMRASFELARKDIIGGLLRWHLWTQLAWNDIKRRYRRSFFGPLWSTLSIVVFTAALGPLYASLMGLSLQEYVPHLVLGMVTWNLVTGVMIEGCREFVQSASYIKSVKLPYSAFVYRLVCRNLIVFAYQLPVFFIAALALGKPVTVSWLLAAPGLLLLLLNALWLGFFCSLVATRFRDFIEFLSSILRILFFMTPIIWMPGHSERFKILADFNPFYHFIELVRAPLLSQAPTAVTWISAALIGVAGTTVALAMFTRYRSRISFWI